MALRDESPKVAIYWDFENLHATLANLKHGENAYLENRFTPQPVFVSIAPVLEYASSLGDIIIHRAYGNWQWFANYRHDLNANGIDLIQMFPRGQNMKNSADIRLALDVLTDIHTHSHLSHVVIVSSDSDFISLAQKIKQSGRFVAGIGVQGFTNRFWPLACNEFKFYQNLLPKEPDAAPAADADGAGPAADAAASDEPGAAAESASAFEDAKDALRKALRQLVDRKGENNVPRSTLKVVMKRLLPSFDETALGCLNFSEFLARCPDVVTVIDNLSGGHVAMATEAPSQDAAGPADAEAGAVADPAPIPIPIPIPEPSTAQPDEQAAGSNDAPTGTVEASDATQLAPDLRADDLRADDAAAT